MSKWHQKLQQFRGKCRQIAKTLPLIIICIIIGLIIGRLTKNSPPPPPHEDYTGQTHTNAAVEYTCSMHPQIRQPNPGLCPICNMELIPVAAEGQHDRSIPELSVTPAAEALMDVQVAPVERRLATVQVRLVGTIEYDETKLANITAWVPGRIEDMFVDYTGVPVQAGDHMVSMYSPDLLSAQEELIQSAQAYNSGSENNPLLRNTAGATLEAAREKLRLFGLTADQVRNIENSSQASDHLTIYAPASGIVIEKHAVEGMYVNVGTRLYTIADLSSVWIMLDAYESDLTWLRYGQEVIFEVQSYPGQTFTGTISYIDPVVTMPSRTVRVRVNADNTNHIFKPGMFVRAVVNSDIAAQGLVMAPDLAGKWICPMHPDVVADGPGQCRICSMPLAPAESLGYKPVDIEPNDIPLVIPASAPLITGRRAIVYIRVQDEDGLRFRGKEIVLGPRAGDYYIVVSGLEEGQMVVTQGNFQIDSALQLLNSPSMMSMPPETDISQVNQ